MGYYYQLRHENNTIVREGSADEYDTEVTFYGLDGCTSYTFQVLAWTHQGNGTFERSRTGVTGVSGKEIIVTLENYPNINIRCSVMKVLCISREAIILRRHCSYRK